ncbi:MAG TPA: hypothetical protein VMG40_09450 [Bryobacteraceae bacterium]|nr:hypothetical protein [Bryobacteraceae bacterium]
MDEQKQLKRRREVIPEYVGMQADRLIRHRQEDAGSLIDFSMILWAAEIALQSFSCPPVYKPAFHPWCQAAQAPPG